MHLVTKVEGMGYTRNVYALNMCTSPIISILFYFCVIKV